MPARFMKAAAVLIAFLAAPPAFAQAPDGAQVFAASCANCHSGAADSRAPALDALRARTPEAIIEALMTGAMRPQGSRLSGLERRAVAEFRGPVRAQRPHACHEIVAAGKFDGVTLTVIEAQHLDTRKALQGPGEAGGGILSA